MLSKNLKNARSRVGWSQERLSEEMSVSRQTVSKWETGEIYPSMRHILMLSKILGCNFGELVEGEEYYERKTNQTEPVQPIEKVSSKNHHILHWTLRVSSLIVVFIIGIAITNLVPASDGPNIARVETLEKAVSSLSNMVTIDELADKKMVGYGVTAQDKKFYIKCNFESDGKPCTAIIYFCKNGDDFTYECQFVNDPDYHPTGEYYEVS